MTAVVRKCYLFTFGLCTFSSINEWHVFNAERNSARKSLLWETWKKLPKQVSLLALAAIHFQTKTDSCLWNSSIIRSNSVNPYFLLYYESSIHAQHMSLFGDCCRCGSVWGCYTIHTTLWLLFPNSALTEQIKPMQPQESRMPEQWWAYRESGLGFSAWFLSVYTPFCILGCVLTLWTRLFCKRKFNWLDEFLLLLKNIYDLAHIFFSSSKGHS